MIFRYSAERPYSEASTTFQSSFFFVKINLIIQVRLSGRKNAAKLPHVAEDFAPLLSASTVTYS